jgi:hypothetical protein
MLVTDREKRVIERDMDGLVKAEGTTCKITRPSATGTGEFYGPREGAETVIAEALPVEFHYGRPDNLEQEGADATADVEFGSDVKEGDFLEYQGVRFRVTDVDPHTLYGARAYTTLVLEREYKE